MNYTIENYPALQQQARLRLLRMHFESKVGHIGGNLSCLDALLVLHHYVMKPDDQFVLSKGHAAGALYTTLWTVGKIEDQELTQFHKDGTRLSGHPPPKGIPDIPFATGSLGHGLSLAIGLALGKRYKGESGRVFCLLSDGEWNEGSNWEALLFACHHRMDNLTLIVDLNGLQGFGATHEVANLEPFADKLRAFGASVQEIDGHDPRQLCEALCNSNPTTGPRAIIAKTHKGCGVSFMQDRMEWHYLPMDDAQYKLAVNEVNQACATHSAALV